jgi:hypothetical protein
MLKKIFTALFLCLIAHTHLAQAQATDTKTDETAIFQLIQDETRYFYGREVKMWGNCYQQDAKTAWTCSEPEMLLHAKGWEQLSGLVGKYLMDNPDPVEFKIERSAYQVTLKNGIAWAAFDALLVTNTGESRWKEIRVLEKNTANEWKISCMYAIQTKE